MWAKGGSSAVHAAGWQSACRAVARALPAKVALHIFGGGKGGASLKVPVAWAIPVTKDQEWYKNSRRANGRRGTWDGQMVGRKWQQAAAAVPGARWVCSKPEGYSSSSVQGKGGGTDAAVCDWWM